MSHGVHLQVTIPTSEPDQLKSLALASFKESWGEQLLDDVSSAEWIAGADEAYEFLIDIREGQTFWKRGNEGDVFLWGMVGNHSDPMAFADRLMPFWARLFELNSMIITHEWQKVLIIYTHSCAEPESGIIEIGWDDPDSSNCKLIASHTPKAKFTCL